jgi:hypothetical protein
MIGGNDEAGSRGAGDHSLRPTCYLGITNRLREALHAKGVTYVVVEETTAIIESYIAKETGGQTLRR